MAHLKRTIKSYILYEYFEVLIRLVYLKLKFKIAVNSNSNALNAIEKKNKIKSQVLLNK